MNEQANQLESMVQAEPATTRETAKAEVSAHSALVEFQAAEIARLKRELGECQVGWEAGNRAVAENLRLQADAERYRRLRAQIVEYGEES